MRQIYVFDGATRSSSLLCLLPDVMRCLRYAYYARYVASVDGTMLPARWRADNREIYFRYVAAFAAADMRRLLHASTPIAAITLPCRHFHATLMICSLLPLLSLFHACYYFHCRFSFRFAAAAADCRCISLFRFRR